MVPENRDEVALRLWAAYSTKVPLWQRMLLKAFFPLIRMLLLRILNCTKEGANDGLDKSLKILDHFDEILSDGRQFLLKTAEPTYVDFAFAAVASIIVMPNNLGGHGTIDETATPRLEDLSQEGQRIVKQLRKRPFGEFVLGMYEKYRER